MSEILYGSEIAQTVKDGLKKELDQLRLQQKRIPKLVVVLVGDNPSSLSYVTGKEKACSAIGMDHELIHLPEQTTQSELMNVVQRLNQDAAVDGILVQLPLPKHLQEREILLAIDPKKDVDGFHPYNIGRMMMQDPVYLPCTPKGIIYMLETIGLDDLSGKEAVVIGRSNIVGKPVAQLLLNKNATVTVCHSQTKDIKEVAKRGDILVVAVGKPRLINHEWIKKGAVVIDVGVNRDEHNKLCGDVDFVDVKDMVSYITPVPKGVGPMTIAMLLENTMESYKRRENIYGI